MGACRSSRTTWRPPNKSLLLRPSLGLFKRSPLPHPTSIPRCHPCQKPLPTPSLTPPQSAKIKWLVAHFRLNSSPLLQRDSRLWKEVIRVLLQFADVISIGGYGETNLISHAITVKPGTAPIKMKHRPLNPVMEESLRQQIDRWLEQRVVEEADSPWSFPLVPVPKKNSARKSTGQWIISV